MAFLVQIRQSNKCGSVRNDEIINLEHVILKIEILKIIGLKLLFFGIVTKILLLISREIDEINQFLWSSDNFWAEAKSGNDALQKRWEILTQPFRHA